MTADGTRAPILLIRGEGNLGGRVELDLLDPDGSTRPVARRDALGPTENLETLVREVGTAGTRFQDVIVDLERVKWINSTGLGWLVGLVRQRKQHGETVALVGPNERVAKILQVTSLDLAMPVHDSLAAAAHALREEGPGAPG